MSLQEQNDQLKKMVDLQYEEILELNEEHREEIERLNSRLGVAEAFVSHVESTEAYVCGYKAGQHSERADHETLINTTLDVKNRLIEQLKERLEIAVDALEKLSYLHRNFGTTVGAYADGDMVSGWECFAREALAKLKGGAMREKEIGENLLIALEAIPNPEGLIEGHLARHEIVVNVLHAYKKEIVEFLDREVLPRKK